MSLGRKHFNLNEDIPIERNANKNSLLVLVLIYKIAEKS